MKRITVKFTAEGETESQDIPVVYETKRDENKVSHFCKVDLQKESFLEWLKQTEFECYIIFSHGSVGRPGITMSNVEPASAPNIDTALFKVKVEEVITSQEANPFLDRR